MRGSAPDRGTARRKLAVLYCSQLLLWTTALVAQTPDASVLGTVTDSEARGLAEVKVTATQPATGFTQATRSSSNGEYYFGSLPPAAFTPLNLNWPVISGGQSRV